jgi:hypothetical protein
MEWRKFQKSWGFILTIFLCSLLFISVSFFDEKIIASGDMKDVFRITGQTVLSSAVFLGIVKTLQYTDYFKEEINDVIYTDKYLKGLSLKALREKWVMLTNVLHSTAFPSLKNNLNSHLLDSIIATPKNYTHAHMRIIYELTPIGNDKQFFKLSEKVDMKINGQKDATIEFIIRSYILKEDMGADKSDIRLTELIIDGKNLKTELPDPQESINNTGLKKIAVNYQHSITNKPSFSIIKKLETIHSTRLNAYWQTDFETFVEEGLEVTLHYDKEIFEVDLLALGQTISLTPDTFEDHVVKYVCSNLIFQNDCLLLIIKYK